MNIPQMSDSIINRDHQHGGMEPVGAISQAIKEAMRIHGSNCTRLTPGEREALDMIAHKIARILSGNDPHDVEHWTDLAGYAHAAMRGRTAETLPDGAIKAKDACSNCPSASLDDVMRMVGPTDAELLKAWEAEKGIDDSLRAVYDLGRQHEAQRAEAQIAELRKELERERLRLAICGVVAIADTPQTAAWTRDIRPEFRSASLEDVIKTVDQLMACRAELAAASETIRLDTIREVATFLGGHEGLEDAAHTLLHAFAQHAFELEGGS
jgi:hypothetical protein